MKRTIVLLLALALTLSCFGSALAEYDTPMTFTTSFIDTISADCYNDDAVYHWIMDRFNLNYEPYTVTWDNWAEKDRVWINGGTMPDLMEWNFDYTEYLTYVDQGMLAPMPDGWEETYPNLYNEVVATGCYENLKVDGKVYALPRVTLYMFPSISDPLSHTVYYFRKDWANELGYDLDGKLIPMDTFKSFLKDCIDKDMAGNGATIGLTAKSDYINNMATAYVITKPFVKVNGEYIWTPTLEENIPYLEDVRTMYQDGLIDPDFYLDAKSDPKNKFASGLAAVLCEDGPCPHFVYRKNEWLAANPDSDPGDVWNYIGSFALCADNGEWRGESNTNYWTASIFNPDIDTELQARILALLDFTCTKEAQEVIAMGIPGVDFTYAEDGSYVILREASADGSYPDIKSIYPSCSYWYILTVLADSFTFVDPSLDQYIRDSVNNMYAIKGAAGGYAPLDMNYELFSSDAKSIYSVDINNEMVRLILDPDADIAAEWNEFVENNRPLWQPVVEDLNAAFCK